MKKPAENKKGWFELMDSRFDELINSVANEDNKKYMVSELLKELLEDDSWEKNPQKRFQVVMMLKAKLANA